MLQNTSTTIGFQKIMVYKTPPGGGGGGEVDHIWLVAYNYRLFKTDFERSHYLDFIPENMYKCLLRFRTRNHRLPVECGRWKGIPLQDRKCSFCDCDIGDEYHYLLICPHYNEQRRYLMKPFYYRRPNILKYNDLMNSRNKTEMRNLCRFIAIILKER